jgi:hypothetical protein
MRARLLDGREADDGEHVGGGRRCFCRNVIARAGFLLEPLVDDDLLAELGHTGEENAGQRQVGLRSIGRFSGGAAADGILSFVVTGLGQFRARLMQVTLHDLRLSAGVSFADRLCRGPREHAPCFVADWRDPRRSGAGWKCARATWVFLTQILPFADDKAVALYGEFERSVYDTLRSA